MKRDILIKRIYSKFSEAEGNQHIASEYAITKIIELIRHFKPKKVLEVGLGIGSVSGTILQVFDDNKLELSGTERNEFCLKALNRNLEGDYERLKIFPDLRSVEVNSRFDMIIIDGSDENLELVENYISDMGIIIVEGDRKDQIQVLRKNFPSHSYVHSISMEKNHELAPFSSESWQGGLKIIFIKPGIRQIIWWLKERIFTKLKYFYRAMHTE